MAEYLKNIPLGDAMKIILSEPMSVKTETLHIKDSLGRVLADDITASHNIPHFDRSPFDGYAFIASDTDGASKEHPVTLRITEEIRAGDCPRMSIFSGEAAKILTGAPIPSGADAVTKYESTKFNDKTVTIFESFKSGSNIVYAGEDIKQGEIAAKSGSVIDPPLIGLLASLGISRINVASQPKVALCTFGSELIDVDNQLMPGKIRNSNLYTFSSYLRACGISPLELGIVPDNISATMEMLERGAGLSDLLITTGGVSVGDYDLVRLALTNLGAEILFWKMDIKPGSSVLVSKLGGSLILSLSGNPAAAVIGYKLLGIPYIRKFMGRADAAPALIKLKLTDPVKKPSPRPRIIPGFMKIIDGVACFSQHTTQGNGVLSSLVGCELLGMVPAGSPPLNPGEYIDAFTF